nr:reverse transcriptase domain-containing protein [Tanacetum cinerariifolium]
MLTRASNSKLVEQLPEPKRTLNRRCHRRNRRVPYDQRNNPPQNPRIVYSLILDISHFRNFLVTLENLYPTDDEPMWAADRVVAPTPGFAITIPENGNEFAIKGNIIKIFYHGLREITQEVLNAADRGIFLYKTPNQAYQLLEYKVLLKLNWAKNQKTKPSLKKTVAFANEGSSNSDTDKIMARMNAMTLKWMLSIKNFKPMLKKLNPILMKMTYLCLVKKKLNSCKLFKQLNLGIRTERMTVNIDSAMKHSYLNDDTCFSIDVIDEILKEDFDTLLDEGSKILHSIEGTLLEEEIFTKFDEFMAMIADKDSDSESDTEEPPFKKITINTDYKIKTSLEEPPAYLELKPLLDNLEYVFLEEPSFLSVIISSQLSKEQKQTYDKKPIIHKQRRLNLNMQEIIKKEIVKLMDTDIIYLIADSPWVSPIHCVPKKGGNENDELVPTRTITGWRVCIDYCKLNEATAKDHFPLLFMDQMLERLAGNKYFCFLDGFSRYFQIPIDPNDQEKTTFTCPFSTYAYRRMPFGLCNAPATFQRKGTENVATDHLSRIENDEITDDNEVDDNFPGETLMEINTKDEP